METFSASLAICAGNSPVTGEFSAQRPVARSFDVFFDLRLNKVLNTQSWGWWFETLSRPLWRHCNAMTCNHWTVLPMHILPALAPMSIVALLWGHGVHVVDPGVSEYWFIGQRSQVVPFRKVPGEHGTERGWGHIGRLNLTYGSDHGTVALLLPGFAINW